MQDCRVPRYDPGQSLGAISNGYLNREEVLIYQVQLQLALKLQLASSPSDGENGRGKWLLISVSW